MTDTDFKARRILITGARGMLGSDLCIAMRAAFVDAEILALGRDQLDIADKSQVQSVLGAFSPACVINAAAFTNVDAAETKRDEAIAINARGPMYLARACSQLGAHLVHFSTDQVFDGSLRRPYTETDSPSPANHYASTKWEGDQAVLSHAQSLVLRVQWLYGERKDRFSLVRDMRVFHPFSDQFGCPTWSAEVAATVAELVGRGTSGLFHFAYDDYASWADVFEFVKQTWGLERLALKPRTAEGLPARRPGFSVMSNAKLCGLLGRSMGSWRVPLARFLNLKV